MAKVLILDDESCISEMLAEMLRLLGYDATACQSPRDALALVKSQNFDVILSDFHMPQMNGEQFFAAATAALPDLRNRFVFLTGDSVDTDRERFFEQTGRPYLGKPFDLPSLQSVVIQVLRETGVSPTPKI